MTKDAWISLLVKILLMVLTPLAAQLHINDGATLSAFATDLADAVVLLYGMYQQWDMKRIHKDAVAVAPMSGSPVVGGTVTGKVVGLLMVAFALSAFLVPNAKAADLSPVKAIDKALTAPVANCTPQNCSGWYVGFGILGDGSNADVVGNGINGSVFSEGGALRLHAGYQLWNAQWFAAIEAGIGYEFTNNSAVQSGSKFVGTELIKLGYNFFPQAIQGVTTPGQSPVPLTVSANLLAASTPYFVFGGMQRRGISEWVNGVGVDTVIAAGWSSGAKYLYAPSQQGVPATNVVMFDLSKHF